MTSDRLWAIVAGCLIATALYAFSVAIIVGFMDGMYAIIPLGVIGLVFTAAGLVYFVQQVKNARKK